MEDQRNTGKVAIDFIRQFLRTYDRKTTQAQLADRMNISALMANVLLTRKKYDDPHFVILSIFCWFLMKNTLLKI